MRRSGIREALAERSAGDNEFCRGVRMLYQSKIAERAIGTFRSLKDFSTQISIVRSTKARNHEPLFRGIGVRCRPEINRDGAKAVRVEVAAIRDECLSRFAVANKVETIGAVM